MPGNTFGTLFKVTTWGESHGKALGAIVDGCPSGLELDESIIQNELDRRRPGAENNPLVSKRTEEDRVEILSGVFEGKATGMPISMIVWNKDQKSKDYSALKDIYRPGHADKVYQEKYGMRDYRGGGRSSGRETVSRVMAGAIAKKILKQHGCKVIAYTKSVKCLRIDQVVESHIEKCPLRCADPNKCDELVNLVLKHKEEGDSVGGVVEIVVKNPPASLGEPVFDKLNADLAKALMSIGTVKGVEFGAGFPATQMLGSEHNALYLPSDSPGEYQGPRHLSAEGISGGISTGEDIIIRIAVKPPSSISKEQTALNKDGVEQKIKIEGRHDACVLPRVIPVAESMIAVISRPSPSEVGTHSLCLAS